jgi:hypothetical protein
MVSQRPIDRLLARLGGAQRRGDQYYASCPTAAHEHGDRSRGLAIRELDDGRVLLHCHAGCPVEDVLAAIGISMSDLYPDRPREHRSSGRSPRLSARDALEIVRHEVTICAIVMGLMLGGNKVRRDEIERAQEAIRRVHRVVGGIDGF